MLNHAMITFKSTDFFISTDSFCPDVEIFTPRKVYADVMAKNKSDTIFGGSV